MSVLWSCAPTQRPPKPRATQEPATVPAQRFRCEFDHDLDGDLLRVYLAGSPVGFVQGGVRVAVSRESSDLGISIERDGFIGHFAAPKDGFKIRLDHSTAIGGVLFATTGSLVDITTGGKLKTRVLLPDGFALARPRDREVEVPCENLSLDTAPLELPRGSEVFARRDVLGLRADEDGAVVVLIAVDAGLMELALIERGQRRSKVAVAPSACGTTDDPLALAVGWVDNEDLQHEREHGVECGNLCGYGTSWPPVALPTTHICDRNVELMIRLGGHLHRLGTFQANRRIPVYLPEPAQVPSFPTDPDLALVDISRTELLLTRLPVGITRRDFSACRPARDNGRVAPKSSHVRGCSQ